MSHATQVTERHASELRAISDALPDLFAEAAGALERRLDEEGLCEWARIGLRLARHSPGSPGPAVAFFGTSPAVGPLDTAAFRKWAEIAAGLAERAPRAAEAFLEATPAALAHLELAELEVWASQGRGLCRGTWKSAKLAARFFRVGPGLLESLSLQALDGIVDIAGRLARISEEAAKAFLDECPASMSRMSPGDREPLLTFAQVICRESRGDLHRCLERGPDLVAPVQPQLRSGLLELSALAAAGAGREGFSLFVAAGEALGTLDRERQAEVIEFAQRLAPHGARAAMEWVASAPKVHLRLTPSRARRWSRVGLELLRTGPTSQPAESYFRIESALAQEMLAQLSGALELSSVSGMLRLYAKALCGEPLLVTPAESLAGRGIGWRTAAATTDGVSIFLPPKVEVFDDRDANLQVYKVYTTHQTGRLEFGSFHYRFGGDGRYPPSTAQHREGQRAEAKRDPGDAHRHRPAEVQARPRSTVVPMQRFLDLFDDRELAAQLFSLAEDTRIDACTSSVYPGIRSWLRRLQGLEVARRPDVRSLPLRQAFVESLLRASLGEAYAARCPEPLAARLERAVATLRIVERPGATVQDAAEVAAVLYDLAVAIPNLPPELLAGGRSGLEGEAGSRASALSDAEEAPYRSAETPEHRGEFKPELVQLLDEISASNGGGGSGTPPTREQIRELLETSAEIEPAEAAVDGAFDLDAVVANIEREATERAGGNEGGESVDAGRESTLWFRYDEWDFRLHDYRPGWCRVGQRTAEEGELDFYAETLRRYHGLVVETRRQFERMRIESFQRLKRLEDGHEIDLDQAIEFHADKTAGAGPLARFYTRRNKVERDVAVAFLLDMSGSTSEGIPPAASPPARPREPETRRWLSRWPRGQKRVIDIEREATVLVVEALEAIGDAYGIYGFSGHTRENVEFHVVKDLDETLDDSVRRRIGGIEPRRATRMGPAIRHAASKLGDHDAKVKILILVSDGRPQDEGYGRDRGEKEYAVHDTKRALLEAKRRRIAPFLITVDNAGEDYLRGLCDDMGYEVVADIDSLPRRLPKLYRHLAVE